MLYLNYEAVHSAATLVAIIGFAAAAGAVVAALWLRYLLRDSARRELALTISLGLMVLGLVVGAGALFADHVKLVNDAAALQNWAGVNRGVVLTDEQASTLLTQHVSDGSLVGGAKIAVQIHPDTQGATVLTYSVTPR